MKPCNRQKFYVYTVVFLLVCASIIPAFAGTGEGTIHLGIEDIADHTVPAKETDGAGDAKDVGSPPLPSSSEDTAPDAPSMPALTEEESNPTQADLMEVAGEEAAPEADEDGEYLVDRFGTVLLYDYVAGTLEARLNVVIADDENTYTAISQITGLKLYGTVGKADLDFMWRGYESTPTGNMRLLDHLELRGATYLDGTELAERQFAGHPSLNYVLLPRGLTRVGDSVFYGCSNLYRVDFGSATALTSIGDSTFYECTSLARIDWPTNPKLTHFGTSTFVQCPIDSLDLSTFSELRYIGNYTFYGDYRGTRQHLSTVILPEGGRMQYIGNHTFHYTGVANINFPSTLEYIGDSTFENNDYIEEIDLSGCLSLNYIGNSTFEENHSSLESLKLPAGITYIGNSTFRGTSLTGEIDLSGNLSLTHIGNSTFEQSYITKVNLSGCYNLERIGTRTFSNAYALEEALLINCVGLTTVEDRTFNWAEELKTVNFTGCTNLERFDVNAFTGCKSTDIILDGIERVVSVTNNTFGMLSNTSGITVVVPNSQYAAYLADAGWQNWTETVGNVTLGVVGADRAQVPLITTQPQGASIREGENYSLTVEAYVTDGGTLTYQWYRGLSNQSAGGEAIAGATEPTYDVDPALPASRYYFYCIITNSIQDGTPSYIASESALIRIHGGGQYVLTYDANGGIGTPPSPQNLYFEQGFVVEQNPFTHLSPTARFKEWNSEADGTGNTYAYHTMYYMPAYDLTLYAIWEEPHTVTLAVEGAGTITPDIGVLGDYYAGDTVDLTATAGSEGGIDYRFDRWESSAGEGGGTFEFDGASKTTYTMGTENTTLTAYFVPVNDGAEVQALIDAAGATPTVIQIEKDYTLTTSLYIRNGQDITFACDGENHSIRRTDAINGVNTGFSMVIVEAGAIFTVADDVNGVLTLDSNKDNNISNAGGALAGRGFVVNAAGSTFVMNGGRVANVSSTNNNNAGAILVSGAQGRFVLNGGSVENNEFFGGGSQISSAVLVTRRGSMEMHGGTVKNNTIHSSGLYQTAGGVLLFGVTNDADALMFTMTDGAITGNTGCAGGVFLYGIESSNWGQNPLDSTPGRTIAVMSGGTISGNTAYQNGGGVNAIGNTDFTFSGGSISGNTAAMGGGISVYDANQYFSGIDAETWQQHYPAIFTMSGGAVSGNTAAYTGVSAIANGAGGGIYIATNQANITAGRIEDNWASRQGGGLYIGSMRYVLRLRNTIITRNDADIGGGVWMCETGYTHIYTTNGAAVYENTAYLGGDDIASNEKEMGFFLYLQERMPGGGRIQWFEDNPYLRYGTNREETPGKPNTGLTELSYYKAVAQEDAQRAANAEGKLFITGNYASSGGGVGTNGIILFGEEDDYTLTVNKVWENVPAGTALPDVEIQLTLDGIPLTGDTVMLAEAGGWSGTFQNLPGDIDPARWGIKEIQTELTGVTSAIGTPVIHTQKGTIEITVTNTYAKPTTLDIAVTKTWSADTPSALIPGTVTFKVRSDGTDTGRTITVAAANGWAGTATGLPIYGESGARITYTLEEANLPYFTPSGTSDGTEQNGTLSFQVENIYTPPTVDVQVVKEWVATPTEELPGAITVFLLENGNETGSSVTITPGADGSWVGSFTGLPLLDDTGTEITYAVRELDMQYFFSTYGAPIRDGSTIRLIVSNFYSGPTPQPTYGEVHIHKLWEEEDTALRPAEVKFYVLANGVPTGQVVTLTEAGGWAASVRDLPRVDAEANLIRYTVEEVPVNGYNTAVSYERIINDRVVIATATNTWSNPFEPGDTRDIKVVKEWMDGSNASHKRPTEITFRLYANGADTGKTITLRAGSGWAGTFAAVPALNGDGHIIEYSVEEASVAGYTAKVGKPTADAAGSLTFTVTNTLHPTDPPTPTKPVTDGKKPNTAGGKAPPKTGDAKNIVIYGGIALILLGAAGLLINRRRANKKGGKSKPYRDDTP